MWHQRSTKIFTCPQQVSTLKFQTEESLAKLQRCVFLEHNLLDVYVKTLIFFRVDNCWPSIIGTALCSTKHYRPSQQDSDLLIEKDWYASAGLPTKSKTITHHISNWPKEFSGCFWYYLNLIVCVVLTNLAIARVSAIEGFFVFWLTRKCSFCIWTASPNFHNLECLSQFSQFWVPHLAEQSHQRITPSVQLTTPIKVTSFLMVGLVHCTYHSTCINIATE